MELLRCLSFCDEGGNKLSGLRYLFDELEIAYGDLVLYIEHIFHVFERQDMIKILMEVIYAARIFNNSWNGYMAFSDG